VKKTTAIEGIQQLFNDHADPSLAGEERTKAYKTLERMIYRSIAAGEIPTVEEIGKRANGKPFMRLIDYDDLVEWAKYRAAHPRPREIAFQKVSLK
jgi:hypothetical protein